MGRLRQAGIDQAVLEAQLLLAEALQCRRVDVLSHVSVAWTNERAESLEHMVRLREARTPLAYIRGTQEFYGLEWLVGPDVLVPRPETEMLVDELLSASEAGDVRLAADVGTGSGCVAISAVANTEHLAVVGLDISQHALHWTDRNRHRHNVADRVPLVRSDLLSAIGTGTLDMVVSNPPYVPDREIDELAPEVRHFEPRLALAGGPDGTLVTERLACEAMRVLRCGGLVALEIGIGQAARVEGILAWTGFAEVSTKTDLAGIPRVVRGRKP